MKHRTTIRPFSWLQAILLLLVIVYSSCKKNDTKVGKGNQQYAEKFFKKPVNSNEELTMLIGMLKTENEKSGFLNSLPENAGVPVWDKLVIGKPQLRPGDAARGIIEDKGGNLLIPLSNDTKTLSALLFAMKKEDKYEFHCYNNNYAYGVVFGDSHSKKEKERVMGLFMAMSNYVFGIKAFKNIPKDLFQNFASEPEENGLTKKLFLALAQGVLPDIFLSDGSVNPGPVVGPTKCYWEFTGKCNCAGSDNTPQNCRHPNDECPSGICTKKTCYTLIFDSENGPGIEPPPGNPNNGTGVPPVAPSTTNWNNTNGSPLPDRTDNLPNSSCGNTNCTWYTEAPEYEFDTPPEPPVDFCDMSLEEGYAALAAVTGTEPTDGYSITHGNQIVDANGIIRRPVAPVQNLVTLNFHWGPVPPTYTAYFQGVIFKLNELDKWKWESCLYNYTGMSAGSLPPCYQVTHNVNVSPIVISEDKLGASVFISFQFFGQVICLAGLTDPQLIYSGGNRVYNLNMGV